MTNFEIKTEVQCGIITERSTDTPALLEVVSNKWIIHISQSALYDALHGLEQKRLVLRIYILHPLKQKDTISFDSISVSLEPHFT